MSARPEFLPEEITRRDLRNRSEEIMDAVGRSPRRRVADQQIAAIALAEDLPPYPTNPDDSAGLAKPITLVEVTRPAAAG
jgi:hypothetical protein